MTTIIWDGCRGIAEDLTPTLNELVDGNVIVSDSKAVIEEFKADVV